MPQTTDSEPIIQMAEFGQFIEIHEAITSGDHDSLVRIKAKSKNLDAFIEDIYRSIGYGTFDIAVTSKGQKLTNHAVLWMMPIVTHDGFTAPKMNCIENQRLLHRWFGEHQAIHSLKRHLPVEAFTRITPTETFTLLQHILRLDPSGKVPFNDGQTVEIMPPEAGFPRLSYLVGAVTRINALPTIPDSMDALLQSRIESTLQFQAADTKEMLVGKGVRVAAPQLFQEALATGFLLWLEEIEKRCRITAWTLDILGEGALAVTLVFKDHEGRKKGVFSHPMLQWQVGASGVRRIIEWCKRWPLEHTLMSAVGR